MINEFCLTCQHKGVSKRIKKEFDEFVNRLFTNCPITDKRVCGCVVKYINIEWKDFYNYMKRISK